MKRKALYLAILVISMLAFSLKANAWGGLCLYGTDKDNFKDSKETALIQIEDATREIWFSNKEVASWDTTTASDGPLSILNFYKFSTYFKSNGTYIRLRAGFDNAYIWNGNNNGTSINQSLDTIVNLYWGNDYDDNPQLLKDKFVNEYRCPEVIIYDGDSLVEVNQDLNITFSDNRDIDSGSSLLNNYVFYKQYDLIEDSYKSDEMYNAINSLSSSLNGTCNVTQDQLKKVIDAFTFNYAGSFSNVTKYLLIHSLKNKVNYYEKDFDYVGLAKKVSEYNKDNLNAEDYLSNVCHLDSTGLNKSAANFLSYIDNAAVFPNTDSVNSCSGVIGDPNDGDSFAYYLQITFDFIQYAGAAACIVLTIFDAIKTVTSDDKDDINGLTKRTITRLIFAGLLFFAPMIIELLLKVFHIYGDCGIK